MPGTRKCMSLHHNKMKETLYTRYRNTVEPMMVENDRKATLQALHTDAVNMAVKSHERNVVRGGRPPPISNSEKDQTRKERSTKIRILWTPGLLQEHNQEGCKPQRLCRLRHDVKHLFVFQVHSTTMTSSDLWSRPADAVRESAISRRETQIEMNMY